jgi:hypothetical protein
MANHLAKGRERMRALGSAGGKKSGEARRLNAYELDMLKALVFRTCTWEEFWQSTPQELLDRHLFREKHAGGSHESDWRCPKCRHYNTFKLGICSKCRELAPTNGRLTRKALRERAAEHRTRAILRKHGL